MTDNRALVDARFEPRSDGGVTETNVSARRDWLEIEGEWLRPAPRPEWGREDAEWWYALEERYRLPTEEESGHKCSAARCTGVVWLVRDEDVTRWDTRTSFVRRSFRCTQHVYDDRLLIEGGRVWTPRPRFVAPMDVGAELARRQGV